LRVLAAYADYELLAAIRNDDEKAFAELLSVIGEGFIRRPFPRYGQKKIQDLFAFFWDKRS